MKKYCFLIDQTGEISRKLFNFLIISILSSLSIYSQNNSTADYFPLKPGNKYLYYDYEQCNNCIPDTNSYKEDRGWFTVGDTIMREGKSYFLFPDVYDRWIYLRKDSAGNIMYYTPNRGIMGLIFKLDAQIGEKWECILPWLNIDMKFTGTMQSKTDTVYTNLGRLINCIRINLYGFIEEDRTFWFAPEIGLIKRCCFCPLHQLEKAEINGIQYPLTNINQLKAPETIFELYQNYPNPFNNETIIRFKINNGSKIELSIYNILGEKIRILANEYFSEGNHEIKWNGKDEYGFNVSSGLYICKIIVNEKANYKKIILQK
jgi:hypothetical protein